jgi:hypothetical protein
MELRIQHHHPHPGMTNGRFLSPSRIINPTGNIPMTNNHSTPDITIRDKTKLLLLADRIQTKKISSSNTSTPTSKKLNSSQAKATPVGKMGAPPIRSPNNSSQTNNEINRKNNLANPNNPNLKRLVSAPSSTPPSSKAQFSTPQPSSLKKSFTRSKLYASFSPSKKSSQLLKSDPTKTNIEHLVKFRNDSGTPPVSSSGNNNSLLKTLHASFHDKTKLANAFSPRLQAQSEASHKEKCSKSKSAASLQRYAGGTGNQDEDDNGGFTDHDRSYRLESERRCGPRTNEEGGTNDENFWNDACGEGEGTQGTAEGKLLTLPKISSAHIIPLNKKLSAGSAPSPPSPVEPLKGNTETNDGSLLPMRSKFVKSETETTPTPTQACGKTYYSNSKTSQAFSHNKLGAVGEQTGFHPPTPGSGSHQKIKPNVPKRVESLIPNPNCENVNGDNNKVPYECTSTRALARSRNPFISSPEADGPCGPFYQASPSHEAEGVSHSSNSNECDNPPETHKIANNGKRIDDSECRNENGNCDESGDGDEDGEDEFDRKKSRSLPKSFMSMRNGLRNVLLPR